jgi:prolyl-tRNA editing enzyme YbaK/EbsC (Cys-tRNA(Pro) deacylase)
VKWPESVERVASVLRGAAAEARLEEFANGTPTAAEAAEAVGCELGAIVKSLLFMCDGRPVLVLVPGDRRVDKGKVAAAVGAASARIAAADEVEHATGFEPGAVAPFPLRAVEQVLIDGSLLPGELVWIGAGSTRHLAGLPPAELVRLARARAVDVVEGV